MRLIHGAYESLLRCAEDPETDWDLEHKFKRHAMNAALDLRDALALNGQLLSALRIALTFAEQEHDCRKASYLPGPTDDDLIYLTEASEAVEAIRAAIDKAEGRAS